MRWERGTVCVPIAWFCGRAFVRFIHWGQKSQQLECFLFLRVGPRTIEQGGEQQVVVAGLQATQAAVRDSSVVD
jgi:hypothetical protein